MTDRYEKIRNALSMGPTPGPWGLTELPRDMQQLRRNDEVAPHDGGCLYRLKSDCSLEYWRGALEGAFRECERIERALGLHPEVHTAIYTRLKQWEGLLNCLEEVREDALLRQALEALKAENERLRAEVERLRADLMESDEIREKLRHLLTRTAVALKGEPPEGVWHSWHDLPEKAERLRADRDSWEQQASDRVADWHAEHLRAERLAEALRKIAALTEEFDDLDDAIGLANEALERENDDA